MMLYKKVPMTFENKAYEIRVYYKDTTINVLTFSNNSPANGLRHQIQLPQKCNIQNFMKEVILDELIEMSKNDIIDKRGERLSTVIRKSMSKM